MRKILLLTACLCSMAAAAGNIPANDTTFIYKEQKIVVRDSAETTSVSVYNQKGGKYKMYYEAKYNDEDKKKATWHLSTSFDFPFSDLVKSKNEKEKKRKSRHKFDAHWAGLGFGFCDAVNTTTGGFNGPVGVTPSFGRSYEIFWNIFSVHIPINNRNWGFVSGLGLNWRNYKMDNNYRFVKEGSDLYIREYPEGTSSIDYSRIKTFDITFPLLLEWQNARMRGRFFVSAGAVLGIKTYSSVKTEYEVEGIHHKDFSKGIHQNPVNVDLMTMVGYRHIGFYFKYSLLRTLQTSHSPQMNALSTGLMWVF